MRTVVLAICVVLALCAMCVAQGYEFQQPTDLKGSLVVSLGMNGVVPVANGATQDFQSGYNGEIGLEYFATDHLSFGAGLNKRRNEARADAELNVTSMRAGSPTGYLRYVTGGKESKTRAYMKLGMGVDKLRYYLGKSAVSQSSTDPTYVAEIGAFYQIVGRLLAGARLSAVDMTDAFKTGEAGVAVFIPIWRPFSK